MSRPIQALIDLSALEHNLSVVRRHAPHARVMSVIKADAYGHGLLRAAEALSRSDGFAMLELDAAVRLREAGFRQTVLLLEGFFSMEELAWIEQYHLSTVIHNREQLAMLSAYKPRGRLRLNIFLKINTGMNRLGFTLRAISRRDGSAQSHSCRQGQITLMTHFARADESQQGRNYCRAIATLQQRLLKAAIYPARWLIPPLFCATRKHMRIGYGPASCFMADRHSRTGPRPNWTCIRL